MSVPPEGPALPAERATSGDDHVADLVARARAEAERLVLLARDIAVSGDDCVVLDQAQARLQEIVATPPLAADHRADLADRIARLLATAQAAQDALSGRGATR